MDKEVQSNYDSIDLIKFILSFVIVVLHNSPFESGMVIFPFARLAVPIFFIASGFFFFNKHNKSKQGTLKRMVVRNLQLYTFWLIAQIPVVVFYKGFYTLDFKSLVLQFLQSIFFGSTFKASWYITALIIGTSLICFLSKFLKTTHIMAIGFLIYIFCCLSSNYRNLLPYNSFFDRLINIYPGDIYLSFPVSIIWIAIGKAFSDGIFKAKKNYGLLIASIATLCIEYIITMKYKTWATNDCYFMLIPASITIFAFILDTEIHIKNTKNFRKCSTIIFCSHGSVGLILFYAVKNFLWPGCPNIYSVTVIPTIICTLVLSAVIIKLSKKWRIFRFAY